MRAKLAPTIEHRDMQHITFAANSTLRAADEAPYEVWEENIRNGLAPVDPLTGIPLHIAPMDKPVWVRQCSDFDDNHHIFHWNSHPLLKGQGGRVVRHSRLLRGPRWAHESYHKAFNNGIAYLPGTDDEKFFVGVMACADIVPQYGIDLSGSTPVIVKLGEKAMQYMQSSERVFPDRDVNRATGKDNYLARRGYFFLQHAMDMGFNKVDEALLDRFIHESDEETRRHLGMMVISAYLDNATKPIIPVYISSQRRGLMPDSVPNTPVKLINQIAANNRVDYLGTIARRARVRLAVDQQG